MMTACMSPIKTSKSMKTWRNVKGSNPPGNPHPAIMQRLLPAYATYYASKTAKARHLQAR
jgi:hypothetical protein